MKAERLLATILIVTVMLVVIFPGARTYSEEQTGGTWLVGVSTVDITPRQEHLEEGLFMGGYGIGNSRGVAEGVRRQVWARSLAISDGRDTVSLTVLDLPGISCSDLTYIRKTVSKETGVSQQNIMISVTHTHAGPDLQGLWGGVPLVYREWLRTCAVSAAVEALEAIQPSRLFYGVADYSEGIINRRGNDELDPSLYLLHARSNLDEPIATLAVFGAHVTFLGEDNKMVSPDFCGKLVANLEAELGGTALFASGIQGDQIPHKGNLDIHEYAQDLTDVALEAYGGAEEVSESFLKYSRQEFPLRVRNPVFTLAYILRYLSHYEVAFSFRDRLHINSGVSYVSIGDTLAIAAVPGEILAKPGLELKDMSPADHTIVIGLTNGTLGYIIHEDQWNGGIPFLTRGYEESVSMGKHVWPTLREHFQKLMRR